jgi:predicted nuclease of predicted toxin-antitoxin system
VATIVVDEDMHRSVADPLQRLGHRFLDIRDHSLRGAPDSHIYAFAQQQQAALLSADLDFSNLLRFPLGSHHGIMVARFPYELSTSKINEELFQGLRGLKDEEIHGSLIVLEPGRMRIRRPPSPR